MTDFNPGAVASLDTGLTVLKVAAGVSAMAAGWYGLGTDPKNRRQVRLTALWIIASGVIASAIPVVEKITQDRSDADQRQRVEQLLVQVGHQLGSLTDVQTGFTVGLPYNDAEMEKYRSHLRSLVPLEEHTCDVETPTSSTGSSEIGFFHCVEDGAHQLLRVTFSLPAKGDIPKDDLTKLPSFWSVAADVQLDLYFYSARDKQMFAPQGIIQSLLSTPAQNTAGLLIHTPLAWEAASSSPSSLELERPTKLRIDFQHRTFEVDSKFTTVDHDDVQRAGEAIYSLQDLAGAHALVRVWSTAPLDPAERELYPVNRFSLSELRLLTRDGDFVACNGSKMKVSSGQDHSIPYLFYSLDMGASLPELLSSC